MKLLLNEKLWVPTELVTPEILSKFEYKPIIAYDMVSEWSELKKQFMDVRIPRYAEIKAYSIKNGFYGFCRGDLAKIDKLFGRYDIEDRRASPKMDYPITFSGNLRDYQVTAVNEWLSYEHGQLRAACRSGKTIIFLYMTCQLGLKTLVLVHQHDLAEQALNRFEEFTNFKHVESTNKCKSVGIIQNVDELIKGVYDVAITTWQMVVVGKEGTEILDKIKNQYGLVVVDESHRSASECFSVVVNNLNAKYRKGVSGTTTRKDNLHCIVEEVIGPVVTEIKLFQLPCQVNIIKTFVSIKAKWKPAIENALVSSEKRNSLIVSNIIQDVKTGLGSVIAVTNRKGHTYELVKLLRNRGITAEWFNGDLISGSKMREEVLNRMREGKSQVLVAQRSMVLGLDIPRLVFFHNLMPSANPPAYYQEYSRIRTPFEDKSLGYIRDYLDDCSYCYACLNIRKKEYKKEDFEILDKKDEQPLLGGFRKF